MTTTKLTTPELAALLGVSRVTIHHWRKRGLMTQPDNSGPRLLFDLAVVRADVSRNRLKVNATFLEAFPAA